MVIKAPYCKFLIANPWWMVTQLLSWVDQLSDTPSSVMEQKACLCGKKCGKNFITINNGNSI